MARYIDADMLLSELQEELEFETPMYTEKENECFNSGVKCAIRDVKRLPTADVTEVKHGEWKHYSTTMMECSICGKHTAKHRYNYCPNCGAKMDGGETG